MSASLQRRPESTALTPVEAQRALVVARARAQAELDALAQRLSVLEQWKNVARKQPLAAVGLAFALGYALARIMAAPRSRSR